MKDTKSKFYVEDFLWLFSNKNNDMSNSSVSEYDDDDEALTCLTQDEYAYMLWRHKSTHKQMGVPSNLM